MLSCDSNQECHLAEDEDFEAEEDVYGEQSDVDVAREPMCVCDTLCPDDITPICASNGKTVS